MNETQIRQLCAGGQQICVNLCPSVAFQISQFRCALIKWYRRHGRDLPWRRTRDPYRILVSEIMLQQTQVDRVIPKYREFLGRYPTFQQLADARLPDVTRAWYPLGYYRRAKHLHGIARETVARYGGRLPDEGAELLRLGGIGR